jgi:hypothetical protein
MVPIEMTPTVPKVNTELPAAEQAAIERRAPEMADAERRIEVMRRAAPRNLEK